MNGPHLQTLQLALKTVGTKNHLAITLGISVDELEAYLGGKPLPDSVLIDALEVASLAKG
jgi:hypothetical protein